MKRGSRRRCLGVPVKGSRGDVEGVMCFSVWGKGIQPQSGKYS